VWNGFLACGLPLRLFLKYIDKSGQGALHKHIIEKGETGMRELFKIDKNYSTWLKELKNKICSAQIKAAVKVNVEMLNFGTCQ
jgi:hypothetical protein